MLVLKDVLDLVHNRVLQGGEEFQPDSTLQTITCVIQVMRIIYLNYKLILHFAI